MQTPTSVNATDGQSQHHHHQMSPQAKRKFGSPGIYSPPQLRDQFEDRAGGLGGQQGQRQALTTQDPAPQVGLGWYLHVAG